MKAHAELGASSAHRWTKCPGSVALCRSVPKPPETIYMRDGSRAHTLGEICLRAGFHSPLAFVGMELDGWDVDQEMAAAVDIYVRTCAELVASGAHVDIEVTRRLADTPDMFGTPDFVCFSYDTRRLTVLDFKYGKGVTVEHDENAQLDYYAACALQAHKDAKSVQTGIVQPRGVHVLGPVRLNVPTTAIAAKRRGRKLVKAGEACLKENAPLVPGAHCRFCPAKKICPARRANEAQTVPPAAAVQASRASGDAASTRGETLAVADSA